MEEEIMADYRNPSPLARDAMAYVLAGGRGTRLFEMTDRRAKPAVSFAGTHRLRVLALNDLQCGELRASPYSAHVASA